MKVDLAEPLGAETLVHGRIKGGDEGLTVKISEHAELQTGEPLALHVDAARVHLFDPDTGRRLSY